MFHLDVSGKQREPICIIYTSSSSMLDDDWTLYSDGTIERLYDENAFSLNNREEYTAQTAPAWVITALLEACPADRLETARRSLGLTA